MIYLRSVLILCLVLISCEKNPFDNGNGVEPPSPVYPEIDQSPAWSPDGSVIAYYHNGTTKVHPWGAYDVNPDSVGLYFISPTGENRRMFLKGENRLPAWSPDGQWIAFVNNAQVYKITVNGDSLTQLTFEGRNFYPAWSPDGKWIAYDRTTVPRGIWIMDDNGENKKKVAGGRFPDWLPNDKHIIYVGFHGDIYLVDVNDTSNVERLTSLNQVNIYATENCYPKYSPDGSKIAFSSQEKIGGPPQIWVMNSDGGNLQQLTQKGGTSPAWSPDVSLSFYTRCNFAEFSNENGHLWVMDSNGENKRQLTFRNK